MALPRVDRDEREHEQAERPKVDNAVDEIDWLEDRCHEIAAIERRNRYKLRDDEQSAGGEGKRSGAPSKR